MLKHCSSHFDDSTLHSDLWSLCDSVNSEDTQSCRPQWLGFDDGSACRASTTCRAHFIESSCVCFAPSRELLPDGRWCNHVRGQRSRSVRGGSRENFRNQNGDFQLWYGIYGSLRLDSLTAAGSYESPYYLLLKRPTRDSSTLQIHKHTIPAHIPLVALVNRYLPQPATTDATKNERPTRQQLPRLVRELRKELVCHHLRHASIALLQQKHGTTGEKQVNGIREITDESGDSRNVRVEWLDGKIGRVRINKEGLLSRCVIFDTKRRRRDLERTVMSGPKGIAYLHDCLALVEKIS